MINKTIYRLLLYFFVLHTLGGCKKVLDTKPFESYSEDLVWSTKATADAFVYGTYNDAISNFTGSSSWESRTPYGAQADQVGEGIDNVATELGIDRYSNWGFGRFGSLRKCNLIIEKAGSSTILSDGEKTALVAEGYFLRGLIFFDMTRKMGRFVPVTQVLTEDNKTDFSTPLTASIGESYDYVINDLDKAIQGLPETSLAGRANKYAALMFRGRAALQAYAYTKDEKYLDIVISSSNEIITSGKYTLTDNYGSMFNDQSPFNGEIILGRYFLNQDAQVVWFPEMITSIPFITADEVRNSKGNPLKNVNGQTFGTWAIHWPTQDLVDQYLAIDAGDGKAKPWYQTSQYLNNVDVMDPSTITTPGMIDAYSKVNGDIRQLPTVQDLNTSRTDYPLFKYYGKLKSTATGDITDIIFGNRDKRMEQTIVRDKTVWAGEDVDMNLSGNLAQGVRDKEDGGWYTTATGYYWRKSVYAPSPRYWWDIKTNFHYVVCRLGEAYMNLAEAYLLKGDVPNAVLALNATRTAHGGLPPSIAGSISAAWADYIRERTCEMVLENGDLYFSYLRWGKYGGDANYGAAGGEVIRDLNRPVYKIGISKNRDAFCVGQLTVLNSPNRNFTKRRYLFPIPQGEIDKRTAGGITDQQNAGW